MKKKSNCSILLSLLALSVLSGCTHNHNHIGITNDNKSQGGNIGNVTSQQLNSTVNTQIIPTLFIWVYIPTSLLIIAILAIYLLKNKKELQEIKTGSLFQENLRISRNLADISQELTKTLTEGVESKLIKPHLEKLIEEIEKFIENIDPSERQMIKDRLDQAKTLTTDLDNRIRTRDLATNNFQRQDDRTRKIIDKMSRKRNSEDNISESEE